MLASAVRAHLPGLYRFVCEGSWARFPRAGRGPVDWTRDYWLKHGGTA